MLHPDPGLLVDVALGTESAPDARTHLESCDECARTVADLRRTAALVSSSATAVPSPGAWESPPPRVWDRVLAAIAVPEGVQPEVQSIRSDDHPGERPDVRVGTPEGRPGRSTGPSVPDVTDLGERRARRPRKAWPWAAGLAAAGLAVGLLTGRALWDGTDPPAATVAQVQLDTLDTRERLGEAAVVRTDSGVDLRIATTTTLDPGDGYLEVWLINTDGTRMISVGVLGGESATFPISQDLLDQGYVTVDISREPFDDEPEHSGDSLVRGTLSA
ncbi:anti-sigma factor domain-containing protein [Intrasporangium sp.]|uniref:anti-sigma factor domain-containing protein n=1 Tax=Intrasporangium sp. TaxID=1925024 RepID=UPI00293A7513|nr:anti-sigma factor [Intrasporangium sp.]MDV3222423.1 anti-sigma factor [Intrasporangium sp.]